MRSIALILGSFVLFAPACGPEEEEEELYCDTSFCADYLEVTWTQASSLYDMELVLEEETVITFRCNNGSVKDYVGPEELDIDCDEEGVSIEGDSPAHVVITMNAVLGAVVEPSYQSEHPTAGCYELCLTAEAEISLEAL
jgi:hypothetical protein